MNWKSVFGEVSGRKSPRIHNKVDVALTIRCSTPLSIVQVENLRAGIFRTLEGAILDVGPCGETLTLHFD